MAKPENSNSFPKARLTIVDVKRDYTKLNSQSNDEKVLTTKTANEWLDQAKLKPMPLMLLDRLWYQSELAILFADTNVGKSIFAVQITDALSRGKSLIPFAPCKKRFKILYCDFEMSDKQFENRYSKDFKDHYEFCSGFYRAELNLDEFILKDDKPIEELISNEITDYVSKHDVDIVIIDNLTYVVKELEKSKNVQPLMQKLKWISNKFSMSILVLAHTPKRDNTKPLTGNDIGGSKFFSNFADSIFAIGKSTQGENVRYVKQIKSRNSCVRYGADNVLVFEIVKNFNFLEFQYLKTDEERNHLTVFSREDIKEIDQQILNLKESHPDWSYQKIADEVGNTNKMRVKRVIDRNKPS